MIFGVPAVVQRSGVLAKKVMAMAKNLRASGIWTDAGVTSPWMKSKRWEVALMRDALVALGIWRCRVNAATGERKYWNANGSPVATRPLD